MNRRGFLKLLSATPLAPLALASAEPRACEVYELDFIVKHAILIDYYRVQVYGGKTYFEIRYRREFGEWKTEKRTIQRDDLKMLHVWWCVNGSDDYLSYDVALSDTGVWWGVHCHG